MYRYFYVKKIHHLDDTMSVGWNNNDWNNYPINDDKLPKLAGKQQVSLYFSTLMDLGSTGLQMKKYFDFSRKKPDGSLVVCEYLSFDCYVFIMMKISPNHKQIVTQGVNPTLFSETIRKENGRIARLMCHTKLVMTRSEYIYYQEHGTCTNKRKFSYAFEKITHGPEDDLRAQFDAYVSQFRVQEMLSE